MEGVSEEEVSEAASPFCCLEGSGEGVLSWVGGEGMGELFNRAERGGRERERGREGEREREREREREIER